MCFSHQWKLICPSPSIHQSIYSPRLSCISSDRNPRDSSSNQWIRLCRWISQNTHAQWPCISLFCSEGYSWRCERVFVTKSEQLYCDFLKADSNEEERRCVKDDSNSFIVFHSNPPDVSKFTLSRATSEIRQYSLVPGALTNYVRGDLAKMKMADRLTSAVAGASNSRCAKNIAKRFDANEITNS